MYVCVFSSHLFWTSSSLDVPAGVTQEEGHTGFFIHLSSAVHAFIFLARRIQPFLSLVDREVEFCALIPGTGIRTHVPTCQKVRRLPTELPGRPVVLSRIYSSSISTVYAQNPVLELVDQQKSVNVYLHIHVQRECSAEEPFMRSILRH